MIDLDALAAEFNIPQTTLEDISVIDVPPIIDIKPTDINEPDKIIATNISKANALLDHVIREIDDGNFSPRHVEVAGQLINAINGATGQLYEKSFNMANIQLKIQTLKLKERQVGILEKTGGAVSKNIIFTDRETVLRLLKEEAPKQIESLNK